MPPNAVELPSVLYSSRVFPNASYPDTRLPNPHQRHRSFRLHIHTQKSHDEYTPQASLMSFIRPPKPSLRIPIPRRRRHVEILIRMLRQVEVGFRIHRVRDAGGRTLALLACGAG